MRRTALTSVLLAALLVAAATSGSARGAVAAKRLTLYAVATSAQFMNHADDRLRGMSNNPFAVDARALIIVTKGTEKKNGPFPGDDVLYSFDLYPSASASGKTSGSAIFTCYYDFFKHALCDAYFQLPGAVVLASGSVAFGSSKFVLSVSGGTGKFLGVGGEVNATPGSKKAQRLELVLT